MLKTILKYLPILCLLISLNTCKEYKTKETISVVESPLEVTTANSTTKKPTTKKYDIPVWPEKPKHKTGKLYPFDNASKDPVFLKFRQDFYNAIQEKDVNFLLAITSDKIHHSFGDDATKETFIKAWGLDTDPEGSGIWSELTTCLELGGKFNTYDNRKRYAAPYVHVTEAFEDPFEEGVIVGDNVRLREGPSRDSKVVGSLSWDMFEVSYEKNPNKKEEINGESHYWYNIKTLNGEEGYVYGKYARSPIDFRVGFVEYEKGKWQMEYFIAGD